jgi:hypothetical protein
MRRSGRAYGAGRPITQGTRASQHSRRRSRKRQAIAETPGNQHVRRNGNTCPRRMRNSYSQNSLSACEPQSLSAISVIVFITGIDTIPQSANFRGHHGTDPPHEKIRSRSN